MCEVRVQLHSFACGYPFVLESSVEETVTSPLSRDPMEKPTDHKFKDLFLNSQFYSTDLLIFMQAPHCLAYCLFVVNSEIRKWEFSDFVLFQIVLAILGSLQFRMNFRILSFLQKKGC